MELLKNRILKDGKVSEGGILKVDSFLNHQIDVALYNEIGKEFKRRFADEKINKILTIEASGIGIACVTAQYFDVPVVFAKKSKSKNLDGDAVATRTAIEECVNEGCKIIFGTSWGYMDTMEQMAEEYPDVVFSHGTGYKSNGKNFNNYFGRIYQARYLSGIAAGLKTKSNKIGYVAAMDVTNSEVTGGINAFAMGVESVNPNAKVYVKVTNSWFSPDLEKQAAEALLDGGCDVIAQHCDTTAPQLAAQARGVWGVGYNSDMTKDAPKAHLTAPIWNWEVYYTKAAKSVMDGTWDGSNYYGGMDEGLVDISPLSENCAEGTKEAIDAAKAKIISGENKIFAGELYDNKGNMVCKEGEVISDADITGNMNWYYRTVVAE